MYRHRLLRLALPPRPSASAVWVRPRLLLPPARPPARVLSTSPPRRDRDEQGNELDAATTAGQPGEFGDHEGQYARTDESVRVEYPEEEDLPRSAPIQGRGGRHMLRTLASFSLDGRVGVVTGGARGLGLVMAQAFVLSGADVALVDMNSP